MDRSCEWCGGRVYAKRRDARYCTPHCRVYANRAARRRPFPQLMVERGSWMRYAIEERRGRMTKVPKRLDGRNASSTDPGSWSSFADAQASDVGAGLGFALGDGIGCIDLDGAIGSDGSVKSWARAILDRVPRTFVEVSQSGKGLHIFGMLPPMQGRNLRSSGADVEVYSTGRFIAVTGERFEGAPLDLADLTGLVDSMT